MPRDGSGVFSAPAGTKGTAGETIQSAPYNAWIDDIIAEMNGARPIVAGGTGAATAIGAFDKLDTKGADIASASSINLSNATGARVNITGTTTVTGVTLAEGRVRIARAAAAFTLEASSSLIVNGSSSVDYTTTAEDLLLFEGYASSVVRVWVVSRASDASPDGGDVASAGTVSLGDGEYFHITGTTTITDIDFATPEDGRSAILVFDGALTLTHHATTLILPGGADITTAAGDTCKVVQDDGDNMRVVWYEKAAGPTIKSYWESEEQTITAAGSLTLAHDLGVEPKMAQALLVCKTAQLGYEVGDKVFINPAGNDPASNVARGLSLVGDADEFRIKYGAQSSVFSIINQSDGQVGTLTPASWKLVIRAWA